MSLVSVLVGFSLAAMLAMFLAKLMKNSTTSQARLVQNAQHEDLLQQVRLLLRNDVLCRCNLTPPAPPRTFPAANASTTEFVLNDLKVFNDSCVPGNTAVRNETASPARATITEMRLKDLFRIDDGNYSGTFVVVSDRGSAALGRRQETRFPLYFSTTTVGANVTLQSCRSAGSSAGALRCASARLERTPPNVINAIPVVLRPIDRTDPTLDYAAAFDFVQPVPGGIGVGRDPAVKCRPGFFMMSCMTFIGHDSQNGPQFGADQSGLDSAWVAPLNPNGCSTDRTTWFPSGVSYMAAVCCQK